MKPDPEAIQKMMQEWMRCAMPGPEHKLLEKMAGRWTTATKQWMDPSAPPSESSGKSEGKIMFGGRFLVADIDGSCMGQPTRTMTIIGYDVYKKKWVSIALGDMGTGIYLMTGDIDAPGKTISFRCEMDDAMGKRPARFVIRIESDDRHVLEAYDSCGGQEFRVVETVYTRVK
jgi:uncharacterized protein DUF1579